MLLSSALLAFSLVASASSSALRHHNLNYDAELARSKLMPMSAAAYSNDPETCIRNVFAGGNATFYQQRTVECSAFQKDEKCSGFTALSHSDQAIIISFRGNINFEMLLSEFSQALFTHEKFIGGGKVARYFLNAFKYVWDGGMKEDFLALKNKHPDYEVWITGHNLGGAIASVCAANMVFLKQADSEKVRLITFGQPRTGNRDYADAHDKLVKSSFRVVHNRDGVVHFPIKDFPIEEYQHHKSEVFYANDMNSASSYVTCPQQEGDSCSDGLLLTVSGEDDMHYFGTQNKIDDYGIAGCRDS